MMFAAKRWFRSGRAINDKLTSPILHLTPPNPQASHRLSQHVARKKRSRPCARAYPSKMHLAISVPAAFHEPRQSPVRAIQHEGLKMNRLFAALGLAAGALVTSA